MIIKNISKGLLLSSLFFTLATPVIAAKKDLTQEITIDSNRQSADLKNKIVSYFGKVRISQGSIAITADTVQVYSQIDEKTKVKSDTYLAKGKPALFKQQLEDGSLISLQANEIKYQPDLYIITVSGNAEVKQAGSQVTAEVITYNTSSEKLEAISSENNSVTTILQPAQIKAQQNKKDNDNNNE
ncbi:MAG: lipopolysaccharide transport periplasmic protein LptA [Gammaproteobacteria bacterium]|nr:MAG: lipopolysaccharide transport periplasmic protein LptA [Gammaproteobacteria bacterium]